MHRLLRIGVALLLFPALLFAQFHAGKKTEESAQPRKLSGTVLDRANHAVPGSIVYLKNQRNLAILTYIVGDDGSYRFNNLSPDIDYQVWADYNGRKSEKKSLSSFDSHKQAHIDLKLLK